MTYRSEERMTTYTLSAVQRASKSSFITRVETSCGDQGFACLSLHLHSSSILRMRIGQVFSRLEDVSCSESPESVTGWVTQVRERVSCPMLGEWKGRIPDGEGLCARSVSSCDRPDQMHYQVYNCDNPGEVYEDRLYTCYGQFVSHGLVYTLTKREDMAQQECFVGVSTNDREHIVMEAGEHCTMGLQPSVYGMKMELVRDFQCRKE